jgi:hypothetical protein
MLRFRHATLELRVGDTLAEVVCLNSHDGSSRYKLMAGLFKLLCLNGMILPAGPTSEVSVRHTGNIVDEVIEGSRLVLDNARDSLEKPRVWSQLQLTGPQRTAFAEAARVLRFGDKDGNVGEAPNAGQLLHVRRPEEAGKLDLWSTFNVVQENVIRGGLGYRRSSDATRGGVRHMHSRAVGGINDDVRLNRALWVLAEKLAEAA